MKKYCTSPFMKNMQNLTKLKRLSYLQIFGICSLKTHSQTFIFGNETKYIQNLN